MKKKVGRLIKTKCPICGENQGNFRVEEYFIRPKDNEKGIDDAFEVRWHCCNPECSEYLRANLKLNTAPCSFMTVTEFEK